MNRPVFFGALAALILAVWTSAAFAQTPSPRLDDAAMLASQQACQSLAAGEKMKSTERIAVVTLVGDNTGYITRSLTTAVTKTRFKIIADADVVKRIIIPKVATDIRIDDLMDPDTKNKLKLSHVQSLLFGWVDEASESPDGAVVRLNLNVIDIASGELLWGEKVKGISPTPTTTLPPTTTLAPSTTLPAAPATVPEVKPVAPQKTSGGNGGWYVLAALVIVAVIVLFVTLGRKGLPVGEVKEKTDLDRDLCERAVARLREARDKLKDAQEQAYKADAKTLVLKIKDSVDKVDRLQQDIRLSPAGRISAFAGGSTPGGNLEKLVAFDTVLTQLVGSVVTLAEGVKAAAPADVPGCESRLLQIDSLADQLRAKVAEREEFLSKIEK